VTRDEFIRKQTALDEGHLSYVVRPGRGPTLILIPGSFSDCRQWDEVVRLLGDGPALVIVELRGHGGSWPPPEDGSIEQFARDVLRVADELGLERFYVGGHSIGGMVALQVGALQPARTLGVISVEGWTHHHAAQEAFGGEMSNTLSPQQNARRAASRERVTARWSEEQVTAFAQIWKRWDGSDFLATTDLPVLEVWGDRGRERPGLDKLHIPERANIEMRWVANASHTLPLERPAEVAEAIGGFIERVEGGRRRGR